MTTATVTEQELRLGGMTAHLAVPHQSQGTGVLVFMEAFGLNDHIRAITRRLANVGHVALAPDLYHRQGDGVVGDYEDPASIMEAFRALDVDTIAEDVAVAHDTLVHHAGVAPGRVGAIGFCLGGWVAFLAAARQPVGAAVCFYGAEIAHPRPGSPLPPLVGEAAAISGRMLALYGAEDPHIPVEEIDAVGAALDEAGVNGDVRVFDDAAHGFFCDARDAYAPDAAALAWRAVLELLGDL